ncbi:MAG: endolytic transglycosylase MltG, partial [Candidatus Paceibacterales bacterium]
MNIPKKQKKKLLIGAGIVLAVFAWLVWEVYVPKSAMPVPTEVYSFIKGTSDTQIATSLEQSGIIKNGSFFRVYVAVTGNDAKLQAGSYNFSPSMSLDEIVKKFTSGDTIKDKVTILEGWTLQDINKYLASKHLSFGQDVSKVNTADLSAQFAVLQDKPENASLEGYIFPDTYEISYGETQSDFVKNILTNFNKKLTPDLQKEIASQQKSVFEVITMASILEREVKSLQDKRVVAGILWKRIENGMPLQVDATTNYIYATRTKTTTRSALENSPYNTYKYKGLPAGPICNPGMDSILAAIYPTASPYWFYISAQGTG